MAKGLFMTCIFALVVWIPLDLVYCWLSGSPSLLAGNTHLVFAITSLAAFMVAVGLIMVGEWVWRHIGH